MTQHKLTAACLLAALLPLAAGAAMPMPVELRDPRLQAAQPELAQMRAELARNAPAVARLDTTPPAVERIALKGKVDVGVDLGGLTAELTMTDDLAGIAYYGVGIRSPSGQLVYRFKGLPKAERQLKVSLDVGRPPYSLLTFNTYSEPGVWKVDFVELVDAVGNQIFFSRNDLRTLGEIQATVRNDAGYDATPPELVSGVIGTTSVSLSKPPRGTPGGQNFRPYVYADLRLKDRSNGQVSVLHRAALSFCRLDDAGVCTADWIDMNGDVDTPSTGSTRLRVGGSAFSLSTPGVYHLVYMHLRDAADNRVYADGTLRGGTTDFSKYFPEGTTITVEH